MSRLITRFDYRALGRLPAVTADEVRKLFDYRAEDGALIRRIRRGCQHAGTIAGTPHSRGYIQISISGCFYLAHRLVWLHVHGEWPKEDIDHINGIKTDNRVENLRDVSPGTNTENMRRPRADNTSGYLGVSKDNTGYWAAKINVSRKTIYIGRYATPELAYQAYVHTKRKLHKGCTL